MKASNRRKPIGPWRIIRKSDGSFQWSRSYILRYGTVLTEYMPPVKAEVS